MKSKIFNTSSIQRLLAYQTGGSMYDRPPYKEWIKTVNPDFLSDNYDLETAYTMLPFEELERWRLETLKDKVSSGTEWHLPSVYQTSNDSIMFLKKGKYDYVPVKITHESRELYNPELKGEFDYYYNNPDFNSEFKLVYNDRENRYYYVRR